MSILVSGFEPFGGAQFNASSVLLQRLSAKTDLNIKTVLLPVSAQAMADLDAAVAEHTPTMVVCCGESNRIVALAVEKVAINLRTDPIVDNAGQKVTGEPVVAQGPAAYFATLPVEQMAQAANAKGVPSAVSYSAGTFLCNALMYHVLHHHSLPSGFVHLPLMPAQRVLRGQAGPSMSDSAVLLGVSAMLELLLTLD